MKHFAALVLVIVLTCHSSITVAETPVASGWKAGVAQVKITPAEFMPMAGYASRGESPATGKLHDLWAKVLVIEDSQGHQAAIVTLDLVGISRDVAEIIRQQLQAKHKWDRGQISFCASHTHSGPVVGLNLASLHYQLFSQAAREQTDQYAGELIQKVVDAVEVAAAKMQPVELAWGNGRAGFAVNRRNNPEAEVVRRKAEGMIVGPSDHDVPVLVVKGKQQLMAVVFGYACHNTTLSGMDWCGDYAGFAQINLEQAYPGAQAMFWAGCGADQNPLPRRTIELAQDYGRQLADSVRAVVDGKLSPVTPALLKTSAEIIPAPLGDIPPVEKFKADLNSKNKYEAARAQVLLKQIEQGQTLRQSYPYPISVWKLGHEVTWVFLGGEVVVDYAIRLKEDLGEKSDPTQIWCTGYSNDVMAYIPSRRVLQEGGYEGGTSMVYYTIPTVWAPEIEDLIVNTVRKLSEQN